jgi:hypothetical protein
MTTSLLSASQDQLCESTRQLSSVWILAKEVWQDSARENFEMNIWSEFESTTTGGIERLQNLIDTIAQAEREIL